MNHSQYISPNWEPTVVDPKMWDKQEDPEAIYADKFRALTQGLKKLILYEASLFKGGLERVFVAGICNGAMLAQQLMFYTDLKIGG